MILPTYDGKEHFFPYAGVGAQQNRKRVQEDFIMQKHIRDESLHGRRVSEKVITVREFRFARCETLMLGEKIALSRPTAREKRCHFLRRESL